MKASVKKETRRKEKNKETQTNRQRDTK
jgi:hypothetical protein